MTAKKSSVKSEVRAEQGRASAAALERDPVTHRFVSRKQAPAAPPAAAPAPEPAGGGAAAPAPFAGPSRGFRARLRQRSSS